MPYRSFREFYPFYLSEHRDRTCRRLHVVGSALVLTFLALALFTLNAWWLLGALFLLALLLLPAMRPQRVTR